ncbi:MAG: AAA family ATPase [bacterium]|nr:AAA family ATPase [bacterium]
MHLKRVVLHQDLYPTHDHYPFNLDLFQQTRELAFTTPVTFFVGENGTGKSTLLKALARRCGAHIWESEDRLRYKYNPYENKLSRALSVEWTDGIVPGSFFASQIFQNFAENLDEWAVTDPATLKHFGGQSLLTQSHGQSLMAFFRNRYKVRGIYFVDEPETALSPQTQLELLRLLAAMGETGQAQFIIASHSPILISCPGAVLYTFNAPTVETIGYEDTTHYQVYRDFMANPQAFAEGQGE